MQRLFHESYKDIPYVRRVEKLHKRALYLLEPIEERRLAQLRQELKNDPELLDSEIRRVSRLQLIEEFRPVKEWLRQWAQFSVVDAYKRLLRDQALFAELAGADGPPPQWGKMSRMSLNSLEQGQVLYEDAAPLLLLYRLLTGWPRWDSAKHIIVDEAQDYSQLQYTLFSLCFPYGNFTVLGDLHQALQPGTGIGDFTDAVAGMSKRRPVIIELTQSYRSTKQIMALAQALLPAAQQVKTVEREGPMPVYVQVAADDLAEVLARDIGCWQQQGWQTVAVVCKTAQQAQAMYNQLRGRLPAVALVRKDDKSFRTGVQVLPIYLAKGLEFDAVAVVGADRAGYGAPADQQLLYVACTRAMHALRLYGAAKPSPLLPAMDTGLLTTAIYPCGRAVPSEVNKK